MAGPEPPRIAGGASALVNSDPEGERMPNPHSRSSLGGGGASRFSLGQQPRAIASVGRERNRNAGPETERQWGECTHTR